MAKPMYKLTQPHFSAEAIYMDADKTVGDVAAGADYNWDGPPTQAMLPLNKEAETAMEAAGLRHLSLEAVLFDDAKDDATLAKLKDSEVDSTDGVKAKVQRDEVLAAKAAKAKG